LVRRNKVLTKANLRKKGWNGNTQCLFYDENESTDHLLIATFNNFSFQGSVVEDLWVLDYSIPLKN
jgi:hypothetical protein